MISAPAHGEITERTGFVTSVTHPGHGLNPRFSAELVDAEPAPGQTAAGERLRLIWIGQRTVPGIVPGCRVRIRGFLAEQDGTATIFNPRFDLLPKVTRD